jgi:MinD-like ATPase involved in chromosome partitioning or flagellar assembly
MVDRDLPRAHAQILASNAEYRGPGLDKSDPLIAVDADGIRALVLRRTLWEAKRIGGPVELTTAGDQGEHRITVTPDGHLTATGGDPSAELFIAASPPGEEQLAALRTLPTTKPRRGRAGKSDTSASAEVPDAVVTSMARRASFIDPDSTPIPAGLVGTLTRLGAPIQPTKSQLRHLENVKLTSQHWAGCRAIAVVNGKGGVGKTMTAAMLAAVFARNGGGSVLAWDNNDTRGTLGWRTETGPHQATVTDAVAAATHLMSPKAWAADIAGHVHHQSEDRYDVLRSSPHLLAKEQRIGGAEFDQLMQVAARFYRLVIFDSGNDESADRWLRMIDNTDQLVVPTLSAPESAESAALLLEALTQRDERSAALAKNAVVVVTESERGTLSDTKWLVQAFTDLVREVVVIPHDPGLKSGPLRFDRLRPATQRAWTRAGAATAIGLN